MLIHACHQTFLNWIKQLSGLGDPYFLPKVIRDYLPPAARANLICPCDRVRRINSWSTWNMLRIHLVLMAINWQNSPLWLAIKASAPKTDGWLGTLKDHTSDVQYRLPSLLCGSGNHYVAMWLCDLSRLQSLGALSIRNILRNSRSWRSRTLFEIEKLVWTTG